MKCTNLQDDKQTHHFRHADFKNRRSTFDLHSQEVLTSHTQWCEPLVHIPKSPLGFYMRPPSFAFYQDLWRPQTRDRGGCNHFEYVPHSGSRNANQLASNQWHIWTPHTEPISEEVWQLVMSLNAHEDEQRCRENHLLGSCEHVQIRLHGRRKLKPPNSMRSRMHSCKKSSTLSKSSRGIKETVPSRI